MGQHPKVRPEAVLGEWSYVRTSNAASPLLNKTQKEKGFNEPSDTVVWEAIDKNFLAPRDVILWNIFPFHPHKAGNLLSNRTPTAEELKSGLVYARQLLRLVPGMKIVAIGQKAAATLKEAGLPCEAVRHPSMGGAARFKEEAARIFAETK